MLSFLIFSFFSFSFFFLLNTQLSVETEEKKNVLCLRNISFTLKGEQILDYIDSSLYNGSLLD